MPNDFDDILKNDSGEFDQQKLLKYLDGSASPEERHEVERLMADSKFTNDAVEGLQALKNKKDITFLVHDLNKNLHQQLRDRKKSKEKRRIKEDQWTYLAIIIILVLVVISYVVIKKVQQRRSPAPATIERTT
jgi:ferric-dicitrate binding protein FerR (iron transport regulator)